MKKLFMLILGLETDSIEEIEERYLELRILTSPSNGGDLKLFTLINVAYEKLIEIINEENLSKNKKYKISVSQLLDLKCDSFNHGYTIDDTFLDISNLPYNSIRMRSKAIITIKKFIPWFSRHYNKPKIKNFKINSRLDYDVNLPIKLKEYGIYSINTNIEGIKNKYIFLYTPFKPNFKINLNILNKLHKYLSINIYVKITKG